ncbi:hypothetical protein GCM10027589_32960 [Actinocorallia lasiicapitis]
MLVGGLVGPVTAGPVVAAEPKWKVAYSAAGSANEGFSAVAATGPKNLWAGGTEYSGALVVRWDGKAWADAGVRAVVPERSASVRAIVTAAAGDTWVFGSVRAETTNANTVFGAHWNGVRWSRKNFPVAWVYDAASLGRGQVLLRGVTGDCGGWTCARRSYRYDGKAWKRVSVPDKIGSRLRVRSAADIWAIADRGDARKNPPNRPTLAHFNGRSWSYLPELKVKGPRRFLKTFTDLEVVGKDDIWASAHWYENSGESQGPSALVRWNGKSWKRYPLIPKFQIVRMQRDGSGGLWLLGTTSILRFSKGKLTKVKLPKPAGKTPAPATILRVPGTRDLLVGGAAARRFALWRYGS